MHIFTAGLDRREIRHFQMWLRHRIERTETRHGRPSTVRIESLPLDGAAAVLPPGPIDASRRRSRNRSRVISAARELA